MIAAWMFYTTILGVLICVGALALERAARIQRKATRWIWIGAIASGCLVPLALAFRVPPGDASPGIGERSTSTSSTAAPPIGAAATTIANSDQSRGSAAADDNSQASATLARDTNDFGYSALRMFLASEGADRALLLIWALASLTVAAVFLRSLHTLGTRSRGWNEVDVDGRRVLVSDGFGPAVFGLGNVRIVVPVWTLQLDAESRKLILAHEVEHAVARDPLVAAVGAVAAVAMPWNPAVWLQLSRLREAIEIDCDSRVLRGVSEPRTYATLLLSVGERAASHATWTPALAEQRSLLERRIVAMSEPRRPHPLFASLPAVAILAVSAVVATKTSPPESLSARLHLLMSGAEQSQPLRKLTVAQDLKISSENEGFYDLEVSATGEILTLERASVPRVFSQTGTEIARVTSGLPADLRTLWWGWAGDSIWIFNTSSLDLIVVDYRRAPHAITSRPVPLETPGPPGTVPQGRHAVGGAAVRAPGSPTIPSAVPQAAGPRYTYPYIHAMYPDGGLLISQTFPEDQARLALGNPNFETIPTSFFIRTGANHEFVSFAPRALPGQTDPCRRSSGIQGLFGAIEKVLPFCTSLKSSVSPDGQRIIYTTTSVPVTNPASVRIAQLKLGGRDTVFSTRYRLPTIAISPEEADSIRNAERTRLSRSPEPAALPFVDSILRTEMPAYRNPVSELYVGNDGSVMLTLLRFTAERYYLLVDPRGNAVGTFTLPSNVLPVEVRGNEIYGLVPRSDAPASANLNDIVRYRVW